MKNTSRENFGAAIRKKREKLGLKVYELAHKVGVNPVYITQIEKHNKVPSENLMKKICGVLSPNDSFDPKAPFLDDLYDTYLEVKYRDAVIGAMALKLSTYDWLKKIDTKLENKDYSFKEAKSIERNIIESKAAIQRLEAKIQRIIKGWEKETASR